jgi:hypothetical protein
LARLPYCNRNPNLTSKYRRADVFVFIPKNFRAFYMLIA